VRQRVDNIQRRPLDPHWSPRIQITLLARQEPPSVPSRRSRSARWRADERKLPLERAAEAYDRMINGDARFRVVLTTGN